uniref:RNA helicase n=1 Tax=Sinocyclocheilus rhinocerous TaxID=307959 RepID=A0A673L0B5_9TELE
MSRGAQKSHTNPSKQTASLKAKGLKDIRIDEEVKIAVNIALERFQYSDEKDDPIGCCLNSQATFISIVLYTLKGSGRYLTVRKKDGTEASRSIMTCNLSHNSKHMVQSLLQRFPITNKERSELQPRTERAVFTSPDASDSKSRTSGRLSHGISQVPQKRGPSELDCFRRALPVFERQEEIIQTIRENQVVLVLGETGSGKTTQIPQFLLDDCCRSGIPCRIFCTQPRRLATIAVAERVAAERGEKIGQTIGYQIRLESRVSPKTLLTFCTSGVLLRTLMSGDEALSTVTHVIVVSSRDGLTDFLLTKMKELVQKTPSLKLILSSATLDVNLFVRYFGACPVIHIKGCPYEVKQLFLEDILRTTGYTNKDMMKYKKEAQKEERQQTSLTEWCDARLDVLQPEAPREKTHTCVLQENDLLDDGGDSVFSQMSEKDVATLEPWLLREMDACISNIFLNQDADAFVQLFNLILNENISVDYRHSETSATPLMVSSGRGFLSQMEQLLSMGANANIKASNGCLCIYIHLNTHRYVCKIFSFSVFTFTVSLFSIFVVWCVEAGQLDESSLVQTAASELNPEDQELLKAYHHSFDDEKVDLDLILHLLSSICQSSDEENGSKNLKMSSLVNKLCITRFQVFILHSSMQTSDQKKVLKNTPKGVRKIILSTNIAETSITVNDVVFVIDSGKVKEKAYDALSNVTMLKMVWISKASALQRKGRAGRCRPGVCFHLFSRLRFNNMLEHQIPQLLRMPLQMILLCLHTKLLAPVTCPIAEFLSKAPEPPHLNTVKHAVQMLKTIDAMDPWENLTELGYHLADLPVEPHLGKMVLCAVVLKCLDPILTIACTLAHRDPFVLPAQAAQKRAAMLCRKRFTANTFSDHMALLRAFQAWQKARSDGWERAFCEKNFLSQATMEIIVGMRTQLLGQLRATGFVRARGGGDIRDVNQNSENWAVVKAALVAGMHPNLIHVERDSLSLMGSREKKVRFHPTSVLSQPQYKKIPPANGQAAAVESLPTDWLIYDEMTRAHRIASVRCCSVVTPLTVAIFAGSAKLPSSALQEPAVHRGADAVNDSSDSEVEDRSSARLAHISIDDWLHFKLHRETAELMFGLRQRWQSLFLRRIRSPSKSCSQLDEATIRSLVSVLLAEEQSAGLQQPTGIGQRPRPMTSDDPPQTPASRSAAEQDRSSPDRCATPTANTLFQGVLVTHVQPRLASQLKNHRALHCKHLGDESGPVKSADGPSSPSSGTRCSSPLRSSVCYFIMKSSNMRNIDLSQQRGIWSTTPNNELKLTRAFVESSAVFLIFSVQGSGHFQGYARMASAVSGERCLDWGSTGLGGVFGVEWIRKEGLPFQLTQQLLNPWNDNKRVQISRDAQQELEPQTGSQLLQLWERI